MNSDAVALSDAPGSGRAAATAQSTAPKPVTASAPRSSAAPPHAFPLQRLPGELAPGFEESWRQFCRACAEQGVSFLPATTRAELPQVWAASDFVATACMRAPALLNALIAGGELDRRKRAGDLIERLERELADCADEAALDARLRRVRRREMVRMAWRDLSGAGDLDETMEGVSALAETCIDSALAHHHRWLSARFGAPRDDNGRALGMVVLGLGKLGGGELNYSSDVDLIFAYEHAGHTRHSEPNDRRRTLDNHEYFTRLGRKLIHSLGRVTADGLVFRVDMRLRPNGDSGPLALSFAAMEQYYQTHGRDWERYALIKARAVAGDRPAGARLQRLLTPFVYRKYLDFTAFDSIREMKHLIEREVRRKGLQDDVKLGRGGIREIEFLVQSHQLIRGGRNRNLRTQSLYRALRVLAGEGVLDAAARTQLLADYRFLRNTEHRLQMAADRQTQRLPEAPRARLRLACSMGFASWDEYARQLERHREHVHRAFGDILGRPANADGAPDSLDAALADLWREPSHPSAGEILTAAGFSETERIAALLKSFRGGRLYRLFSGLERDRIDRLIPMALRRAGGRDNPERAMTAFISVLESIGRRSVYLSLLIENPPALAQLLSLCAASAWISRHIGAHPVIMDELLSPPVDVRAYGRAAISRELQRRLAQTDDAGEVEARMNALREFNHAQILRVAAADVLGVLEAGEVCRVLSQLARVVLQRVFDDALQWAGAKKDLGAAPSTQAGVIAYGKFAAGELGYHSDLDIVVCYDAEDAGGEPRHAPETGYYYARVGQRLIHLLTARTHAGPLYELDMRLRPSGRSGTLVTSLAGFAKYQLTSAWTWEHQALVRARAVAGGDAFRRRFEQLRQQVLCRPRDPAALRADIASMKDKMAQANSRSDRDWCDLKLGRGGIVDIEFMVQYWVLREAGNHPAIARPRTTAGTIKALRDAGVLEPDTARQLRRIYRVYLRKSLDLKLMDRPLRIAWDEFAEQRARIGELWARTFG